MLDKDHVVSSEAVFIGSTYLTGAISTPMILSGAVGVFFGSQLPDVDNNSSKINHYLRPISSLFSRFGHRGFTHSLWCWALFSWLVLLIPKYIGMAYTSGIIRHILSYFCVGLIVGYLLHLIEDAYSKAGVVWFFPFGHYRKWRPSNRYRYQTRWRRRRRVYQPPIYVRTDIDKKWRYRTGGKFERCVRYISIVVVIAELTIIFYTD